jgi:hypothetical protein
VNGEVPEAATENVAVWPAEIDWLVGCALMDGITAAGFTVRTAELLVMLPAELFTTTANCAALSEMASAGME